MKESQSAGDCFIRQVGDYLRATVGPELFPDQVEECYRALATRVLEQKLVRVLVVGVGEDHPHSHLAARDALIAMAEIGVPVGFKLAFVPRSDATLNGYRHAEAEARERGIRARVFENEAQAIRWLTEPDVH
jgi:hypothetical protein